MTSRRAFLQIAGSGSCAVWLALNAPAIQAAAIAAHDAAANGKSLRVLAPEEGAELEAIAEQIFPTDETPGAREADVIGFMDQALDTFMSESLGSIRQGLSALSNLVDERFPEAASFSDLTFERQTGILREIETEPFFGLVRYLTIAGMFALPMYGGNRDGVGWDLLGFEDRLVWQPPFGHYDAEVHDGEG